MNKKKKNIIYYILYLIITTFLISEIILRAFDPFGVVYLYEIERFNTTYKRDPDYFYINRPGFSGEVNNVYVKINKYGLRSPDFESALKIKKRLLILGDSIVFGWGVQQDSIFTYRLYNMFKDSLEIIGAGTNSWNTRAEYEFLRKEALDFKPDFIILIINPNDIYLKPQKQPNQEFSIKKVFNDVSIEIANYSYTFATFLAFYQKYRHARIMNTMFDKTPEALTDARKAMMGIIKICKDNHIRLSSYIYGDPKNELVKKCKMFYSRILNSEDISVNYFYNRQLFSREYTNSFIDGHPNAAGHKIITNQLASTIKSFIKKQ